MKKFLAVLLAVICAFSMATVAFAMDYGYTCDICGGTSANAAEFNKHIAANACGACQYCGTGFETKDLVAEHEATCRSFSATCDYCGETIVTVSAFEEHVAACKTKYFNIPLAKIIATIKDLFAKIDFAAIFNTVKDLGGKLVGALGNIGK